jgi:anti-sigma B factor antagonist
MIIVAHGIDKLQILFYQLYHHGYFKKTQPLATLDRNKYGGEMHMEIMKIEVNEGLELTLTGRLDTVTAPQLHPVLTEALRQYEKVELEFTGVEYMSSAGLRVLLQGQKLAQGLDRSMTLKNVSPEVMEVFDMTGFTGFLTII